MLCQLRKFGLILVINNVMIIYIFNFDRMADVKNTQRPNRIVVKKIGGEKNGGERKVRVSRMVSMDFTNVFVMELGPYSEKGSKSI